MAISRVNPGAWAVGDKFTSSQANGMDMNLVAALDKTATGNAAPGTALGGDTISGAVLVAGASSSVTFQSTSTTGLVIAAGGKCTNNGTITCATGSSLVIASGGVQTVSGQINIANGGTVIVPGGSSGKFTGGNGPSDFNFTSTSSQKTFGCIPYNLAAATGWSMPASNIRLSGPATSQSIVLVVPTLSHGATAIIVTVAVKVQGVHAGVPATLPSIDIRRKSIAPGAESDVSLLSGGPAHFPTPASGAAWDNGNLVQSWAGTLNQNNVIDNSQYIYYAVLVDENGANSVAGNNFIGVNVYCTTTTFVV